MSIEDGLNEYSDLNLLYKTDGNYEDVLIRGSRAIIESLRNIFYTEAGSRFFNRTFGSQLHALLFENISDDIAQIISMTLYNVLKATEPRIEVYPLGIIVTPDYDNNAYDIVVNYKNLTNGKVESASANLSRKN